MKEVFKLKPELVTYKGCGWALACIKDGEIIDLTYVRDLGIEEYDENFDGLEPEIIYYDVVASQACKEVAYRYEEMGEFTFGLCSCWEFNVM
ncbi:anti-CRISPR protein AcrIIC1 [Brackiella oedipodis]|uniref:anti-CRISPR protein AcrIIC1 n=1 Tax=Brackiella oedipodis TaxID=124225 RepID=UPI00048F953F|nr:anti-CRISPR protein AcrIIC1 [Brackiella oedipodis]